MPNPAPAAAPTIEHDDRGRHRLVSGDRRTAWAPYMAYTYLDGYVGCTDYYLPGGGVFPAEEFVRLTSFPQE